MDFNILPKTRKEAKALKSKFYFTGKPCKNGHNSKRQTSDAVCVECKRQAGRENSEYFKTYYEENKDVIKAKSAERHKKLSKSNPGYEKERYLKSKSYHEKYREDNRDARNETAKRLYRAKIEDRLKYAKSYRKVNYGKMRAYFKKHYAENRPYYFAAVAKRRAIKLRATPPWLTDEQFKEIEAFYVQARELTESTGVQYHVDHVIPLQGENVSGLHVPWNLQVITAKENLAKSNKVLVRGM